MVGIEHASRFVSDNVDAKSLELASLAYKSADCNIAVSSHLAKALNRLFNISCEVVHNVYNPFFNAEVLKKQIEKHVPFKFVAIGTLEYRKGYDILISSFKKIQNKYLNSTLTIIGEGEEHATLTNLLIKDGLENCVSLVGRKNKEEIATILSDSDVFVLASRSETFGVVFIEAMALGLPVIGTYCGGLDGIINKSNGVIVPVDDRSAFFDAMEYVYNNYSMYDKDTIIKGCKENYSSIAIAKKLTLIFEKVLKEK